MFHWALQNMGILDTGAAVFERALFLEFNRLPYRFWENESKTISARKPPKTMRFISHT